MQPPGPATNTAAVEGKPPRGLAPAVVCVCVPCVCARACSMCVCMPRVCVYACVLCLLLTCLMKIAFCVSFSSYEKPPPGFIKVSNGYSI